MKKLFYPIILLTIVLFISSCQKANTNVNTGCTKQVVLVDNTGINAATT